MPTLTVDCRSAFTDRFCDDGVRCADRLFQRRRRRRDRRDGDAVIFRKHIIHAAFIQKQRTGTYWG